MTIMFRALSKSWRPCYFTYETLPQRLRRSLGCIDCLRMFFANEARRQLDNILKQFVIDIKTVCQLRNAIYIIFW